MNNQYINLLKNTLCKKDNSNFNYTNYYMEFEDIPEYYEVNFNNYLYIITRFSFIPDGTEIFLLGMKSIVGMKKLLLRKLL